MKENIYVKLNEIIEDLDNSLLITELEELNQNLINDKQLLSKLEKMHNLDIHSSEYKVIKNELFSNPNFVMYKQKENELNLLILEINQRLNILTKRKKCLNENN